MAKYETDVQLPAVPGVQKPGAERYAVPGWVAGQVQDKLHDGTAVEASWQDGCTLSVTVESADAEPERKLEAAYSALKEVVGPASVIPPFHPAASDA